MDLMTTLVVSGLFVVAGGVHRLTGMGFALVVVPPLVLLLGPDDAVTFAALGALLASVVVGMDARHDTDRRIARVLVFAVLVGSMVGVLVAVVIPDQWLTVGIGAATLLAVAASIFGRVRYPRLGHSAPAGQASRTDPLVVAGVLSGVMNATSGIGGPPLSVVASWIGMPHRVFVSTVQVPFVVMGMLTVVGRMWALGVPDAQWWTWAGFVAAVGVGVIAGAMLAPRVPQAVAWLATLTISAGGGAALLLTA